MKDRTSGKSQEMNRKRKTTIIKLAVARPARGYNAYCVQGSRSCHRGQGTVHDGQSRNGGTQQTGDPSLLQMFRATSNKTEDLKSIGLQFIHSISQLQKNRVKSLAPLASRAVINYSGDNYSGNIIILLIDLHTRI